MLSTAGVFGVGRGSDFSTLRVEAAEMKKSESLHGKGDGSSENAEPVFDAASEVDGGCFLEVFGGAGEFPDAEAEHDSLGDHLVVKDEVIRVFEQRQGFEKFAGESSEIGVVFGELYAEKDIL